jgi:hypothetical protein
MRRRLFQVRKASLISPKKTPEIKRQAKA